MVAPVADAGVAHVLWQRVGLCDLRHRPMERGVEAGDLRQARERLGERPCATHVERLVRRLHRLKRLQIVQHIVVDAHRCREAGAAEHDAMAGRYHLRSGKIGFHPRDDETQRGRVVDRVSLAPFLRVQRLAGGVVGDEVWVTLHAVDAAAAQQGQRPCRIHRVRAEFQAGRARVEYDDGVAHGAHSAVSGCRMVGSRANASA